MAQALLVVPPFLKYNSGPLLGPALLLTHGRARGHRCGVTDLNARFIKPRASPRRVHGNFIGDHDKPTGPNNLSRIEEAFLSECILPALPWGHEADAVQRVNFGRLSTNDLLGAGTLISQSPLGAWIRDHLVSDNRTLGKASPDLVGVSLLHAGQLIPAVAVSMVVRQLWPKSTIVWGGPHMSGLGGNTLRENALNHSLGVDVFVTGHAEKTFADLLDAAADNVLEAKLKKYQTDKAAVILGGQSGAVELAPHFTGLDSYDKPLTLPAQSSLGCAYGRCAYCTYPAIEPKPTKLNLESAVGSVAKFAQSVGGSVAIKDSLVTTLRLQQIADSIEGRVAWSACIKLSEKLDSKLLQHLHNNGLATLEVGLESLLPDTQRKINKIQPPELFENFLRHVCSVPGVSVVVNYMTGFPWEDPAVAKAKYQETINLIAQYGLQDRVCVEHNSFELERQAPMARSPGLFGMKVRESWPWASVLQYDSVEPYV